MMAKLSADAQSPRNILNVYAYLVSTASAFMTYHAGSVERDAESFYLSEGTYHAQRNVMMKTEAHILRVLGFQTHVALPYTLAISYLQALDVFGDASGGASSTRTFEHLNSALLSPQSLYLTHHPPALAAAAIYLGARDVGVKLPAEDWWEVFDVDREELGFLVVGMRSMADFAMAEKEKWNGRSVPMTVEDVEAELNNLRMFNGSG